MRAMRFHEFGGRLAPEEAPDPAPAAGETLVRVLTAAVNPVDIWVTQGTVAGGTQPLPFIPGTEGVVEAGGRRCLVHGEGVGLRRDGLFAELAAVPDRAVVPLPDGVETDQAAAMGVAGSTAWVLVHRVGRVTVGDRVVVLGASGGVGSLAMQMARNAGAAVWGQTGNPEKAAFVASLGAGDAIVAGPDSLHDALADLEPTVVIDPLGDGFTAAALQALRPFGRLVLYGASAGHLAEVDLRGLYRKSLRVLSYSGTIEPIERLRPAMEAALTELAAGRVTVPIDAVLPLAEAPQAFRRILDRQVRGKLLLKVSG